MLCLLLFGCGSWFVLTIEGISFWSEKNGILKQKLTFAGNLVSVELVSESVGVGSAGMIAYQFRVNIGRDYLVLAGDTMQVPSTPVRTQPRRLISLAVRCCLQIREEWKDAIRTMYQQAKDLENDRFCQNALEVNQRSKNNEKKRGMLNTHAKKMAEKVREEANFIDPEVRDVEPMDHMTQLPMDYSAIEGHHRRHAGGKQHGAGFGSLELWRQALGWLPAGAAGAPAARSQPKKRKN